MIVLSIIVCSALTLCQADYWTERDKFIKSEESLMLGSSLLLSNDEQEANEIIMGHKIKEYDDGFLNPQNFLPSRHFFETKSAVEASEVFKILLKMPKGAALHSHDTALASEEYLYSLTHNDHLYACTINNRLALRFLSSSQENNLCKWTLIKDLRLQNSTYDAWVKSQLTLNVKNPRERYPDINVIWNTMRDIFATIDPFLTYKPVFEEYFYQSLKELYDDNVLYLEFRGELPTVYDLNGRKYDKLEVMQIYADVIKIFKTDHPDFIGARLIYAPLRHHGVSAMQKEVKVVKQLKKQFPDLLAGFDVVGQEDLGKPTKDYIDQLQDIPRNVDFYFHSGETNWYGTSSDANMIDAILMGTKRIGHGFGLTKHPELMKIVKRENIAIEVCPISNQVLMLVEDLRNHPASLLISQGYPIVISYDDPSFWSVKGLTYDFYMTFMGIASRAADLRLLKQLAINSIQYSSLPVQEKSAAMTLWETKWTEFIKLVISTKKTV